MKPTDFATAALNQFAGKSTLCPICIGKTLASIALPLLQFPQSSAAVERSFGALQRVHTWQRGSLGREKLAKMIYIYVNCSALRKLKII